MSTHLLWVVGKAHVSKLNPANIGKIKHRLTLWCEMPGNTHPVCPVGSDLDGEYTFPCATNRLQRIAPYASKVATVLKYAIPLTAGAVTLNPAVSAAAVAAIKAMEKTVSVLLKGDLDTGFRRLEERHLAEPAEGEALREFHQLLLELDDKKHWGGLRRVHTNEGDYLWVCKDCHKVYDPGLPDLSGS